MINRGEQFSKQNSDPEIHVTKKALKSGCDDKIR